jgi:pentatricopeptide repeat domain-containing protein 1
LINVCEKIKDWKRALELLRQMDDEGVAKNEITYSSAISACEKGGNWRTALDLLSTMKKNGIMPTVIAYNAGA